MYTFVHVPTYGSLYVCVCLSLSLPHIITIGCSHSLLDQLLDCFYWGLTLILLRSMFFAWTLRYIYKWMHIHMYSVCVCCRYNMCTVLCTFPHVCVHVHV